IKSINEQHDAVTAKLLSYEELLSAKNDELAKLKKESGQAKARLAELQSEGETLSILRAQEPQASLTPPPSLPSSSRSPGGVLSLDQLSRNLESKDSEKKKAPEEVVDENLFYCPKCNKSFTELRPLEGHVNRCLDED
ncbi:hypothetical protein FHG87_013526, partial [Trinorchestia longiramus]